MRIRNKFVMQSATWFLKMVFKAIFATTRKQFVTALPDTAPHFNTHEKYYLYCMWHDEILGPTFAGPTNRCAALVSRHSDGSLVADIVEALGMKTVRGSSGKGAVAALKQMMQEAESHHICIATDGPRGPRRVVKNGIIFLASQTGRAIVPHAFVASRMWRPKAGWTDLAIPVPFSRAYIFGSWPMHVPAGLDREGIERYRQKLQVEMDRLNDVALRFARGEDVELWPNAIAQLQQKVAA